MERIKFCNGRKNHIICLFIAFFQIVLFSCSGAINTVSNQISEEEDNFGQNGYLSIKLDNKTGEQKTFSRSVLTLDEISSLVTAYELLIFNDSEYQNFSIKSDTEKLSVPAGTWNIICLAGTKKLLIGSGYVDNVLVEDNKITDVEISMYSIDVSLTADKDEIYCNDSYKISVNVNTKNPYLIPDYIYAGKKISFKNSSSADSAEIECVAEMEESDFKYTTSLIYFRTNSLSYKLSECSGFKGIYNSSVIDKEGVTSLSIYVSERNVNTGVGLSVNWLE